MTIESLPPVNACIIDNNRTYVYGFKKLLSLKYTINHFTHFDNGRDAIAHLKIAINVNNLPDLIFLDIYMPIMDGWEFMKEFEEIKSQLGKKIAVYILSSSTDMDDVDRAKNISSISDYIFKPLDAQHLTEIFNNVQALIPDKFKSTGTD